METNPYAAPGAVVDDAYVLSGNELEARKASRLQRFGAERRCMHDLIADTIVIED